MKAWALCTLLLCTFPPFYVTGEQCGHDRLLQDTPLSRMRQEAPQYYGEEYHLRTGIPRPDWVKDTVGQRDSEFSMRAHDVGGPDESLVATLATGRQSIRITFNTDKLSSDGQRTCFSTGATYVVGDNPTSTPCSSSVTTDCTGTCTSEQVLTTAKRNYVINTILPEVKTFFEGSLLVTRTSSGITFPDSMSNCGYYGGVDLPKKTWPDTDMVIFITARPTQGSTVAWAGQCAQDMTARPVAGQANWNPAYMNSGDSSKKAKDVGVLIHELTHALGFSSSKFSEYRDGSGSRWANPTVSKTKVYGGSVSHTINFLATPRVKEVVQKHFGCGTSIGGQLEDGGGSGTVGSHWEKRIFKYEYMMGTTTDAPIYSSLTLAALADSGWYDANYGYSKITALLWGNGLGCSFSENDCGGWTGDYKCSTWAEEGCSPDGLNKGSCTMKTHASDLPAYYQHYGTARDGGTDSYADYCAFYLAATDCRLSANAPGTATDHGESYASDSRCFRSAILKDGSSLSSTKYIGCYAFRCTGSSLLEVKIGSTWVSCPSSGGVALAPSSFSGNVTCPATSSVCPWPKEKITPTYTETSGAVSNRPYWGGVVVALLTCFWLAVRGVGL